MRYYYFDVGSTDMVSMSFKVYPNPDAAFPGDVNLVLKRALPVVELGPPDDALLRAVLVKLFADRQLAVDESLLTYLVTRIDRSFAAARAAVERLDREALRLHRPVTRALAAETLLGSEP